MVAQVTPPGIANLGYKFWIIWAVLCFSFIPTTYFFYPETANRTLEDIDRYFAEHRNICESLTYRKTRIGDRLIIGPCTVVFNDKLATQLKRPEIWEKMDEEVARRDEEMKIRNGDIEPEREEKDEKEVIYLEK